MEYGEDTDIVTTPESEYAELEIVSDVEQVIDIVPLTSYQGRHTFQGCQRQDE
jgi:hypothetical protein